MQLQLKGPQSVIFPKTHFLTKWGYPQYAKHLCETSQVHSVEQSIEFSKWRKIIQQHTPIDYPISGLSKLPYGFSQGFALFPSTTGAKHLFENQGVCGHLCFLRPSLFPDESFLGNSLLPTWQRLLIAHNLQDKNGEMPLVHVQRHVSCKGTSNDTF
eukprot:CAMPEP_0178734484 /NCGR_PEP_ID=MMETSP0744-20121128/1367_1 /TAXON_ID=913974 /ORGANISM="Nitzschia punctata, Strain CCMP561" /LENGTH=156 /DNA_ID=CAMNT_0020386765 /DNA_START=75 /DNA_END=542 /DNA_ORIENTATION=+